MTFILTKKATLVSLFKFEVVTVNAFGQEVKRTQSQAQYFTEDLGNDITLDLVAIRGGKFIMGALETEKYSKDQERPQHEVTIQPFFMGKFPVTQAQWRALARLPKVERELENEPSHFQGDNRPVEQISWYDTVELCKRLSRETGREYRLPSEAEWEYAIRAGMNTPFHCGETITSDLANYIGSETYENEPQGESRQQTTDVGSFPPNAFGLYDLHGNVYEWCADDWHENYEEAPTDGSVWLSDEPNSKKVLRGGSWYDYPSYCRCAYRLIYDPIDRGNLIGLRVVCAAPMTF